uniref:NIDO domain-containing protein n=1 Tax=Ciona savignyi TaxID=51511 RepID=H2YV73_CIOSA
MVIGVTSVIARETMLARILIGIVLFGTTHAKLYPYGVENGDEVADCGRWNLGSVKVPLNNPMPFLGGSPINEIWVSTFGSLSTNKVKDHRVRHILNNTLLAPFFVSSQPGGEGIVVYRQVCGGNDSLLEKVANDVAKSKNVTNDDFSPTCVLVVTWDKVSSLDDSGKQNTFQAVLASDGEKTYVIYNYPRNITWVSGNNQDAVAGVFISGDLLASCEIHLPGSDSPQIQNISRNSWVRDVQGRYVIEISDPIKCASKFVSPCGNFSEDRGTSDPYFQYREDGSGRFYRVFTCNIGFHLSPGVNTYEVDCTYDPDYYTYEWSELPNACLDLNATRTLHTSIEVTQFNDTDLIRWYDDPQTLQELLETYLPPSIERLVEETGITGVVTNVDTISNITRQGNSSLVVVGFTTYIPTYNNKRLKDNQLENKLESVLQRNQRMDFVTFNPNTTVQETSSGCLQSCLCWMNYDPIRCRVGKVKPEILPDACCGCPGQAYTSSLKACCNNRQIYDPTKAVCCGNHVRQGTTCPPIRKFRNK